MSAKSSWLGVGLGIVCLAAAGCREPAPEPSPLSEAMRRQMLLTVPTVGGPSEEFTVGKEPGALVPGIKAALKNSGVRVVQEGNWEAGQWLLGKSLADRSVLVQILPIYPGRSTVKLTVEGADTLTRELMNHLAADIGRKVR